MASLDDAAWMLDEPFCCDCGWKDGALAFREVPFAPSLASIAMGAMVDE